MCGGVCGRRRMGRGSAQGRVTLLNNRLAHVRRLLPNVLGRPNVKIRGQILKYNGSEWEKYFVKEVKKRKITLVYNYPQSPKMNAFVERVNGTVKS